MQAKVDLPEYAQDLWKPFRHLAWYGGRGAGKSRSVATGLVLQAVEGHQRVLCGREVQKSIRDSVKRCLDDEIRRLGLSNLFDSVETEIRGPNDSLFLFSGIRGNASAIKSIEGITTFWGEEAQGFSQASIDTVIPTIRAKGSRLIWTWNPDLETDPVDVLFRGEGGPPPGTISRLVNYENNPWFPQELRSEMEYDRKRDYDKFLHVWRGEYRRNSEARVFKNWTVEEFDSPGNVEYRLGADFGFSIDPSVMVRCWIDGTRLFVDHEAWGLGVEIDSLPHLFLSIPDAEVHWTTADSSRPETISYLRRHGFPRIQPAIKGARSLEEGVEFLKSYDLVIHPRCQHLIDELTHYSYEVDKLTGQVIGKLEDKHNHCIAEGESVLCGRGMVPIEEVTTEDIVWTRAGWRRVLFAGQTDVDREIVEVVAGDRVLRCTPDHEVWVSGKGMVRADALRYGDELLKEMSPLWPSLRRGVPAASTTNSASVANAESFSQSIASLRPQLVPVRVRTVRAIGRCAKVYDLTVEGQHEFVASGLLVSNCIDALRYAVEGARRAMNASPRIVNITIPKTVTAFNRR